MRNCSECGASIEHLRQNAITCSGTCRVARHYRRRYAALRAQIDGKPGDNAPDIQHVYS